MTLLGMHVGYKHDAEVYADAHAVLMPAFETTNLSEQVKRFLETGGCTILLGESREEYVARGMSAERRSRETPELIAAVVEEALGCSPDLLVAVDQEIAGICRLHDLVPQLPDRAELERISEAEFEETSFGIGKAARSLGINCFLGPVLDVPVGESPWLAGRIWTRNFDRLGQLSTAFVRGVQRAGVAATAKHFPGYRNIVEDPALDPDAKAVGPLEMYEAGLKPFRDVVSNGVEMVMAGPAVVEALDAARPASTSATVIGHLRNELGFGGVVMTDDLDAKAILRGGTVEQAAVGALNAGAELLLLADTGAQIERVASAISVAARNGEVGYGRLAAAARKVRSLCTRYSVGNFERAGS